MIWREVDARHFLGMTVAAMRDLVSRGLIRPVDPDTLAHLFTAMLTEGVLMVERAADPVATRAQVEQPLTAVFEGLRS